MRTAVLAVSALVLAFVAEAGAASRTSLTVIAWPDGPSGEQKRWTLRCGPVGGTLPRRAAACARLAQLERPFAATPKDAVCTMIYGGPQVARVVGTFNGRRIWTTFRRRDGCEIARWNRHKFLFPISVGVGTSDGR